MARRYSRRRRPWKSRNLSDPSPTNYRRRLKIFGALMFAAALLGAIFIWTVGGILLAPANHAVGPPPARLHAKDIQFASGSGAQVHGWLAAGQPGRGVVVLMHGIHADRRVMVARAEFLLRAGYSVLLFDFQGHGESLGRKITFGFLEGRDATAAVQFARASFPGEKIGVIGVSMGAAAALLAEPSLPVNALVLESSYPTIYSATENRLVARLGFLGKLATPLLTCQLKLRLGVGADDLRPIVRAGNIPVPKLFVAGTVDRDTTLSESRALFAAAAAPRELWLVGNAAHVDLHAFARAEYERRILEFLAKNLG